MKVPIGTKIYLKFGKRIAIPVNPEEITIAYPSINKTYEVLGVGEIVVPRKPGLQEISWEGFFPGSNWDPYTSEFTSPQSLVKTLTNAKKNKRNGRLIITRSELFDTNIRCIVEEFETRDKGGEPGDIYYSLKLKEYRPYSAQTVAIIQPQQQAQTNEQATAVAEEQRPVETPVLRVGATVIANGKYWNDEYGGRPFGTANNLMTQVTRITNVGGNYPIHIGHYGWLQESQLQIVG